MRQTVSLWGKDKDHRTANTWHTLVREMHLFLLLLRNSTNSWIFGIKKILFYTSTIVCNINLLCLKVTDQTLESICRSHSCCRTWKLVLIVLIAAILVAYHAHNTIITPTQQDPAHGKESIQSNSTNNFVSSKKKANEDYCNFQQPELMNIHVLDEPLLRS